MKKLLTFLMSITLISGLSAEPVKPDFAYPKTVDQTAQADLKVALKAQDDVAILNALIRSSLAQTAIKPEDTEKVAQSLQQTADKCKHPIAKAMIALLQADMLHQPDSAASVMRDYADVLMAQPVADWKGVVTANSVYFPSLYDFAAAQAAQGEQADSIASLMMARYESDPIRRVYWALRGIHDFESAKGVYDSMEGCPESAFPLVRMADASGDIPQRAEAYALCRQWLAQYPSSPYKAQVEASVKYLTRPSLVVSGPNVVARNQPYHIQVRAVCLNAASVNVGDKQHRLKFAGEGVFAVDTILEVTFPAYGEYVITPVFTGQSYYRNRDSYKVTVTDLLLQRQQYGENVTFHPLNILNGAPVKDAQVVNAEGNQKRAVLGDDKYSPAIYNGNRWYNDYERNQANILTDRAIYHPGESLRFMATLIESKPMKAQLLCGEKINVVLKNANWQAVDTLSLISDNFGRVVGQFKLPADGLTGSYRVEIPGFSSTSVMVTDYQAPTFEVTAKAERLSAHSVRVYGTAVGYNGFPLAEAQVEVELQTLPRWVWWWSFRNSGGRTVATVIATTNEKGEFDTTIDFNSDDNLKAIVKATSPTGETHDAQAFVPNKPFFISAEIPQYLQVGKDQPEIKVLNAEGEPAQLPLTIRLTNLADSTEVTPAADWSNVPSGEYSVEIRLDDPALADPYTLDRVYVYRPSDKMPPATMGLFVPQRSVFSGDNLLIGTSYFDSHILYTLWNGEQILKQQWLTPKRGNIYLKVELPDSVDSATLTLSTVRNYQPMEVNVRVEKPQRLTGLQMAFSSFRDRMVPGERERWSISVTDNLGHPAPAAVILDVYAKALDALQPLNWSFNSFIRPGRQFSVSANSSWTTSASAYKNQQNGTINVDAPSFYLYGRHWPYLFTEYAMVCAAAAPRATMKASKAMFNSMDDADAIVVRDYAGGAIAESAEEEDAADNGSVPEAAPADDYRLPEVPVALWAPALTTAPDGSLQVEFEAPNANTTWRLMARTYNRNLLLGSHQAEIIASKPIMVQPQWPRFMHVGDTLLLRGLVQNATDTLQTVTALIEIFDPFTGEVFESKSFEQEIEANSSAPISLEFTSSDRPMLGLRMRATAGNFTDGEQTAIPVLPADMLVRTGRPLFIAADSTECIVDVPKGGVMTFTTNAAWECVTALPGLQASDSKCVFAAISALYSASVARGLLRDYPIISSTISRWQQEDSTLVSKLTKNQDLKIAMLESTPWPGAAQSDTERMARLLLLLDKKETNSVIDNSIQSLAKLVKKGGFRWTPDSDEPSPWVTEEVLSVIADLRRLNYQPSDSKLSGMIAQAVKYLDDEVGKAYSKDKILNYEYALLRPYFPEVQQSAPARRAQQATVQDLVAHWKQLGLLGKSRAALILFKNGYQSTARSIIESLRQYEAWEQLQLSPTLLEAFATVEPVCPEVDLIRQFFIERKQAQEWGTGIATTALVTSILTSGSDWLVPAENELSIKVDGLEVKPSLESALGAWRIDLPDGGEVHVTKGKYPAWGGVFSASVDSITSVEAFGSDKVKITRRIEGDTIIGSRVKVILEIDATQALDYVVVKSPRAAAMSVVNQLPGRMWFAGASAYREPTPTATNWFFRLLPKGHTVIEEEYFITADGSFILPPAELQSQYAPEFQAHTSGTKM